MMKKFGRVLLIYFVGMGMFLSTVGTITGAEPTVGDITLIPDHPAPQSVVTFSVDIDGDSISSVRIIVSECNKAIGLCHAPPQNASMRKANDNTYEAEVTLQHDDVTSITYHIVIKSDGEWTVYDEYTTTLSMNSGDSDTNGNASNETPGFEIMVFLLAIMSVVLLFKKFKPK